jgi:hypothetical protein
MLQLIDVPALFTTVTAVGALSELDTARAAVADFAGLGEIGPALADQLRDHLDATERTILITNACI